MAVTKVSTDGIDSPALIGTNLIHNGAMNVAQRGTSVTGAGAASGTLVQDQFIHMNDAGTGRYTVTQTADGPVGFANCLKIDCTTADASLASGVLQRIETRLEAQNLQHLAFGNAAAKTITLSFYVKCTSTGTMSVLLQQQDGGRSWHKNYTIDATDTWERKTLVYTGDASGSMADDTGIGFSIYWTLTSGTDFQGGTSGSWTTHNNNLYGTSGDLNVFGSTATNWFITGIQLEVGGVATDFEHEDFGTTLAKCQRYFRLILSTNNQPIFTGYTSGTTTGYFPGLFDPVMRSAPTLVVSDVTDFTIDMTGASKNVTGVSINKAATFGARLDVTTSGLTAGQGVHFAFDGSGKSLSFVAEL